MTDQPHNSLAAGLILLAVASGALPSAAHADSQWVRTGSTGRLIYVPDAQGDRILDFSAVGYQAQGLDALPGIIPQVVAVAPVTGDDTATIQAAIDQVSALPLGGDGFRGAVVLQAGAYDIHSQLEIRASGVVLRGAGSGAGGTVLRARNPLSPTGSNPTPNQRPLIRVYGNGGRSNVGATYSMVDKVVPAGSMSFRSSGTSGLSVGDTIRIERPSTQAWIDAIGMDNPPNGDPPWTPGSMNVRYDRTITRIEGDRVFVDAPLANAFELQYGGGTFRAFTWNGAIDNIGIENLRAEADFLNGSDEDHAWEFVSIGGSQNSDRAQHVWVRDVSAAHFGDSLVVANPGSKWVTVDNATSEDPVSVITGERRYTYDLSGELGLVANSRADQGRHDFVNNSSRPAGPNVFFHSVATNAQNDSGPHQRWATGTLFDNLSVQGNAINVRNRGSFGTSHGWSGANMVVWNSAADSFRVQNPPTAQNWLIGSSGTIVEDTTFGPQPSGNYDSHGSQVTVGGTTSLYQAQRNDAREIRQFRFAGGTGNWHEAAAWEQQVTPGVYRISVRDYLIGDIDELAYDGSGSVDDAPIDPGWAADILASSSHPITGLDIATGNQNVAFTLQHALDPGERVVHAWLALALEQSGGAVDTDFVRLFDMAPQHRFAFTDLGWDTQVGPSERFVGVLDLGPNLAELQTGKLNVQINDDTAVDWAIYAATVATPVVDPTGPEVFLDAGEIVLDTLAGPLASIAIQPAATLTLQLGGSSAGQWGALDVQGVADVDGTLRIELADGFTPEPGNQFELLTANTLQGQFDTVELVDPGDALAWNLTTNSNSIVLTAVWAADFDADGDVDDADLQQWRLGFGGGTATHLTGDADGDGDADGVDFLVWQSQRGNVSFSQLQVVPEPSAVSLWGLALIAALKSLSHTNSRKPEASARDQCQVAC
jgi:hypothetical protein